MTRRFALALLSVVLLVLAGCGFALRPPQEYGFKTVYYAAAPTSLMAAELRRYLASSKVELITEAYDQTRAEVFLDITSEQRIKTVVGYSTSGQARELQLRLVMRFRLRTPQGKELIPEAELSQQRSMSYDETYALAKEAEEASLYRSMQSDIVQLILRRMASVKHL
jgi:LPS-assembly lipoprotein